MWEKKLRAITAEPYWQEQREMWTHCDVEHGGRRGHELVQFATQLLAQHRAGQRNGTVARRRRRLQLRQLAGNFHRIRAGTEFGSQVNGELS